MNSQQLSPRPEPERSRCHLLTLVGRNVQPEPAAAILNSSMAITTILPARRDAQIKKTLLAHDRHGAAIHEAGHAAASHVLGWQWVASIERAEGERARFSRRDDGSLYLKRGVWVGENWNPYEDYKAFGKRDGAIICWAGAIAETLLCPEDDEPNLFSFQELVSTITEDGVYGGMAPLAGVSNGDAGPICNLANEEERAQTLREAWALIEQHKDLVLKIAATLEQKECAEDKDFASYGDWTNVRRQRLAKQ